MAILHDFHLHSTHSTDSDLSMEDIVFKSMLIGFDGVCFTDHHDIDTPDGYSGLPAKPNQVAPFILNAKDYLEEYNNLRLKYNNVLELYIGVELGLQPHLSKELDSFVNATDWDFIIGSSHLCNGKDPYNEDFFDSDSDEVCFERYFLCELECAKSFANFDVYGHLDYVMRYGRDKYYSFNYSQYSDILDELLTLLIHNGKGIEINAGGYRKGPCNSNPNYDIIKRYKELGGEIITIGSDAHRILNIGSNFDKIDNMLQDLGYKYYTIFQKREPIFIRL